MPRSMGAFAAPIMRRSNNTPGIYLAKMPSALIPRPKVSATRSLACPWTSRKVKLAPSSGPGILIISLRSRIQKYHIFSRGKDEGGGGRRRRRRGKWDWLRVVWHRTTRNLISVPQDFNSTFLFSSTAKLDEMQSKNEAHSSLFLRFPTPPARLPLSLR